MKHALVIGGAGFIGSNFTRFLVQEHGFAVTVYDALTYAGNRANISDLEYDGSVAFVRGDITDADLMTEVISSRDFEWVVNFAAESHNSLAIVDPARFFATNVMGTLGMLEACRRVPVRRLHHISTCEVFGDLPLDSAERFAEGNPYLPRTPYNASKASADHAVRAYFHTYGVPASISIACNNYGPYQFPEKVIPLFVSRALQDQPLPVYRSSQNRREWIHVTDHCRALYLVLTEGRVGETYNIGTADERSVDEIAEIVLSRLGKPRDLRMVVDDRPSHDRRYLLDSTKLRRETGWEATLAWDLGIAETIGWYAANRDWWQPLLGRSPVVEGSSGPVLRTTSDERA